MTDPPWRLVEPHVRRPQPGGRVARDARREIVNAIPYQARDGCVWRALPHDRPSYRIAFQYVRAWQADGTWDRIRDAFRAKVRRDPPARSRRRRWPSRTARRSRGPSAVPRTGNTGGKKVAGRERFVAADTNRRLRALVAVPADTPDRHGRPPLMDRRRAAVQRLEVVWGDAHVDTALAQAGCGGGGSGWC